MSDRSDVAVAVDSLNILDLDGLRLRWRTEFGKTAPPKLTKGLLRNLLAYRLQARAFGDLSRETRKLLDDLGKDSADKNQPIPWVRVYEVTPGVSWSHRRHLQAGMQCVMCHGQVAQVDAMAENTSVTSMASCISCHQGHKANTDCQTCHAWPRSE